MAEHRHMHWHPGLNHDHPHEHGERNHHAAAPFGKAPEVTHIGPDLAPDLERSIEAVKEKDASTNPR